MDLKGNDINIQCITSQLSEAAQKTSGETRRRAIKYVTSKGFGEALITLSLSMMSYRLI